MSLSKGVLTYIFIFVYSFMILPEAFHNWMTERKIGYKMAIHNVEMQVVCPGIQKSFAFRIQITKIGI